MFTGFETPIETAPPTQRDRGLLLQVTRDLDVARIGAGAEWKPWGPVGLFDGGAIGCDVEYDKTADDLPANTTQQAFLLWRSLQCSTLSRWAQVLVGRIESDLRIFRSASVANELESGALSGGHSLKADAEVVSNTAASLLSGIMGLEAYFASVQPGARAIIHLTPALLVRAVAEDIVEWRDGQYRTGTGSIVIGDSGHTGAGEPADTEASVVTADQSWIYVTGDIWYAEARVRPFSTDGLDDIDLTVNIDQPLRELVGLLVFDPTIIGATKVTIAP